MQLPRNTSESTMEFGNRRRREIMISNSTSDKQVEGDFLEFPQIGNVSAPQPVPDIIESSKEGDYYIYFYKEVPINQTKYVLNELKHYSQYTITVKACRSGQQGTNCSNESIIGHRTAKIGN